MNVNTYSVSQQAIGEFDGGKITEQKPIGFPGEGSAVTRVGPLFYWAWAFAGKEGFIPPHPHQAFEIMTYVVQGEAHHGDSLGSNSIVGPGGVQLIQAGSGVQHSERIVGPDAELFQIWFEPSFREARERPPAYTQHGYEAFPVAENEGTTVKTVIGSNSPLAIVADANVWDIAIQPGSNYTHLLGENRSLAVLAMRGNGAYRTGADVPAAAFEHQTFLVADGESGGSIEFKASEGEPLRLMVIEVPTTVEYPLYQKRR